MNTARVPAHPKALFGVCRRFEHWRKTRRHRSPTPDTLRMLAVQAAREHGLHQAARALRLSHAALKQRLKATGEVRPLAATFVELLSPRPSGCAACTLELENARGVTLGIHLQGITPPDLVALSRTVWSEAS